MTGNGVIRQFHCCWANILELTQTKMTEVTRRYNFMGPLLYVAHQWLACSGTPEDYTVLGYSKLRKRRNVGTENEN